MLKNSDKYEAQKKLKEARDLEAFNKAWDKADGVSTEAIYQKDSKGKLTGMATSVLEGEVIYEKQRTPYEARDKEINREHILDYELLHHKKHGIKDNIRWFYKLKNNSKEFLKNWNANVKSLVGGNLYFIVSDYKFD